MLNAFFSYEPFTQEVSLVDKAPNSLSTYQLVDVFGRLVVLGTAVGIGVRARLGHDGVYKLVLQRLEMLDGIVTVAEESEPVMHLQMTGSVFREASLYAVASCGEAMDYRDVLCERYRRQKAILAYSDCNYLVANHLLKGDCRC